MNQTFKTVLITLAVIAVLVQFEPTRNLLNGQKRYF